MKLLKFCFARNRIWIFLGREHVTSRMDAPAHARLCHSLRAGANLQCAAGEELHLRLITFIMFC